MAKVLTLPPCDSPIRRSDGAEHAPHPQATKKTAGNTRSFLQHTHCEHIFYRNIPLSAQKLPVRQPVMYGNQHPDAAPRTDVKPHELFPQSS